MQETTVAVGLPDLRRVGFDAWFVSLFLKYDRVTVSNRWDTRAAFKEKMKTISENVKDVFALNWSKFSGGYNTMEVLDEITWTDAHYNRLVENHAVAVRILKTYVDKQKNLRGEAKKNFKLPFSTETLLKLEQTIITRVEKNDYDDNHAIDAVLKCNFRATDLIDFITKNPNTVHPMIAREACPFNLIAHAYNVATEQNSATTFFAILQNPSGDAKLRDMRMDIINNHNYDILSLCTREQVKDKYYEAIRKCAEQHGFVLKVEAD